MSSFGVYVIQLRSCDDRSALGALYVGSSWYPPSERFRQHNEGGATAAVGLRGQCRRLRPELYADLPWHWDRRTVFATERARARRLADAGFHVRCDGTVYAVAPGCRTLFTGDELERVHEQFDEAVRAVRRSALRPLTVDDIVRVLRWTPNQPTVRDLVSVPNEHVGRFSHADETVVRDRAARALLANPKVPGRQSVRRAGASGQP